MTSVSSSVKQLQRTKMLSGDEYKADQAVQSALLGPRNWEGLVQQGLCAGSANDAFAHSNVLKVLI